MKMRKDVLLRHWQIQLSGYHKSASSRSYRANKTISVASHDIVTAIRAAEDEMNEDFEDILVISANHKGEVHLVVS